MAFTLRYAVYKIYKEKLSDSNSGSVNNLLSIIPEENNTFDQIVSDSYKLKLFVSFSSKASSFGMEICEALLKLDRQFNLNLFSLFIRISSEDKKRWDRAFVEEHLTSYQRDINKIYVVGPVPFMDDIKGNIIASGIAKKEQMIFV